MNETFINEIDLFFQLKETFIIIGFLLIIFQIFLFIFYPGKLLEGEYLEKYKLYSKKRKGLEILFHSIILIIIMLFFYLSIIFIYNIQIGSYYF